MLYLSWYLRIIMFSIITLIFCKCFQYFSDKFSFEILNAIHSESLIYDNKIFYVPIILRLNYNRSGWHTIKDIFNNFQPWHLQTKSTQSDLITDAGWGFSKQITWRVLMAFQQFCILWLFAQTCTLFYLLWGVCFEIQTICVCVCFCFGMTSVFPRRLFTRQRMRCPH